MTTAETFVWYRAHPRISLGVAHLWKQNSLRWLASVSLVPESGPWPQINGSIGVQGIGTGNPGYSLTAEKSWQVGTGRANAYVGVGWRSNEDHSHFLGGFKYSPDNVWTLGLQLDGHDRHPFVTYSWERYVAGFFLIDGKAPAYMLGVRF